MSTEDNKTQEDFSYSVPSVDTTTAAPQDNNTEQDTNAQNDNEILEPQSNQWYSQYQQARSAYGIEGELNWEEDKISSFTEDSFKDSFKKDIALSYARSKNPDLAIALEHNVDYIGYQQQANQYDSFINQSDDNLIQNQINALVYQDAERMGRISRNEEGQYVASEEMQKKLAEESKERLGKLTSEESKNYADRIRNHYKEQKANIPNAMKEYDAKRLEVFNQRLSKDKEAYMEVINNATNKESFVTKWHNSEDKESFINYSNQMLSPKDFERNGRKYKAIPVFEELQSNAEFMAQVIRLSHLHKSGYFTDVNNRAKSNAFNALGISGNVSGSFKSNSNKGGGDHSYTI